MTTSGCWWMRIECFVCRIQQIGTLGQDYRHGAGVLDIQFDSAFTLLTCGYDTIIRLWDLRASLHQWYPACDELVSCRA